MLAEKGGARALTNYPLARDRLISELLCDFLHLRAVLRIIEAVVRYFQNENV